MKNHLIISLRMTAILTIVTCGFYPLAVFAVGQLFFRDQANGSFGPHGSQLIGQSFTSARFFHSRPSAAGADGYDATASTGTNLGPTSKKLRDAIAAAVKAYDVQGNVPADAVTSSGSGLDPHISPANAYAQAPRVARANGLPLEVVRTLVSRHTEPRLAGIFGEPRVNVLGLNEELASQQGASFR
jgi:K+-transporting ATPase ATPase C chain